MTKQRKGFTMLEVMAVLVILVILIMIVMPDYSEKVEAARRMSEINTTRLVQDDISTALYEDINNQKKILAGSLKEDAYTELTAPKDAGKLDDYRVYSSGTDLTPEDGDYTKIFKDANKQPFYKIRESYIADLAGRIEEVQTTDLYLMDKNFKIYKIVNGETTEIVKDDITSEPEIPGSTPTTQLYDSESVINPEFNTDGKTELEHIEQRLTNLENAIKD